MKSLKEHIIEEGIKDKIKSFIDKFKKEKIPEKVYSSEDLEKYKGQIITPEDADDIIDILIHTDDYFKEYLINKFDPEREHIRQEACKHAILDYAYENNKDRIKYDKFGENHANQAEYECSKQHDIDSSSIAAGGLILTMIRPYIMGWSFADKMKFKTEEKYKPTYKKN